MTQAIEIITEALESIGVLGVADVLPAEDSDRALRALNTMIDGLNAERATIFRMQDEQFTLPNGAATRTIGPAGQFNTVRPQRIEWAFLRVDGSDYQLEPLTALEHAYDPGKSSPSGWPYAFYYEASVPLGVLHFVTPPTENFELHLGTWSQLASFATTQTAVDLSPGAKEMLVTNLAVRMAPRYERSVSAEIAALAVATKRKVKNMSHQPLTPVVSEAAWLNGAPCAHDILAGR